MKNILSSLAALSIIVTASTPAFSMNCVAYARQVTGMNLSGDAWHWWDSASGVYSRGHQPAPGAVMVFARTSHMTHGHVAVVREVVGSREILIDQANWLTGRMRGAVTEAVAARDVSPSNDWSAVEVQWARSTDYGRVNPIRGFVYGSNADRNSSGMQDAVLRQPARQTSGFQNASFSPAASFSSRSFRHHVVFRHAPVRANCAHAPRRATRLVRLTTHHRAALHKAHANTAVAKHAVLAKPVSMVAKPGARPLAAVQNAPVNAAIKTPVAVTHAQPVAVAKAVGTTSSHSPAQHVAGSLAAPAVAKQAALHQASFTAPIHVNAGHKITNAAAFKSVRLSVQRPAAAPVQQVVQHRSAKLPSVQSASVHVSQHGTSASQTN